jgi:RNA polymerase sigma-70 factor (ECF subfamily)
LNPPAGAGRGLRRRRAALPSRRRRLAGLYRQERRPLFAFFWARLGDREEALDLVQEVFLRAVRHAALLCRLPAPRRRAWLFACARRLTIDRYRRRAVAGRAAPEAPPQVEGPEGTLEWSDELRRLDRAIRLLPQPEREALALVVLGGRTSGEAAALLGRPAGTVRYHLLRARRRLKAALGGDGGGAAPGDSGM